MNWLKFCLEDRHKLVIHNPLAEAIGLNEAIFVRQLYYWTQHRGAVQLEDDKDGRWWVYSSHKSWRDRNFRFWSERTVRRIIEGLIKDKIVLQKRRKDKQTGAEQAPYYTLDINRLDKMLKDYFDKNPDSVAWYLAQDEDSEDMDNLSTPPGQNGQQQPKEGEDKSDTPPGQNGHQRDSKKEIPDSFDKENQKREENAARPLLFAAIKKQKYNDGTYIDPLIIQSEYNTIFYAAQDALEECGFAALLDLKTEWEKQREGAIALTMAKIKPEDLKAYIQDLLKRDENKKNWYLDGLNRPSFGTIANKIGTWLKERESEASASKKQGSSWSAHSEKKDDYLQSPEGQRRILLGMLFGPIEPVNARLAELGLEADCSIEALQEALQKQKVS